MKLEWLWNVLDIGIAIARGMLNPKYGILTHLDLERIDGYDFRAWLIENGATPSIVNDGSEVRALYDLPFAYEDGQLDRPSFAAGTALRAVLRIAATYKGAVMFLMQSGMGEAVVAPLYEVLSARGVKFEFFHKVKKLELSADKNVVARVHFGLQARTVGGKAYEPTFRVKNVTAWPSEPFWDQLEDGARMRADGVNFESHWCARPDVEDVVIKVGDDFDDVVLGISLGAFKKLNREPTMCDELYDASPRFAAMANALSLVPTQAVQLWTGPTLAGLGWADQKPAMDAAPEILDVWADMSQELPREDWRGKGPGSIQYFCSIFPTDLYARPSTDTTVPAQALAGVRATAIDWFSKYTGWMWPKATTPANPQALDYGVLYDEGGGVGVARLDAQWLRANVDPTECFVTSVKGTTAARLGAEESGFVNLVLAGDWTKNGINAGCVEAAVMSGMAASRAICGSPARIVGEDFSENRRVIRRAPWETFLLTFRASATASSRSSLRGSSAADTARSSRSRGATWRPARRSSIRCSTSRRGERSTIPSSVRRRSSCSCRPPSSRRRRRSSATSPIRSARSLLPLIDLKTLRLGLWLPYVFISSSLGMVTGREVWGFQKEISTFQFPAADDPRPKFVASATIFPTLTPTTLGQLAPLVTVQKAGPIGALTSLGSTADAAFAELLRGITGGTGKLVAHLTGIAHDVAELFGPLSVSAINFKQFRDAVDPTRACYQAIVESPLTLDQLTGFGLLGSGYTLSITPCESHAIAADLGIAATVPISFAYYVDIGFRAMPGRIVWQAT